MNVNHPLRLPKVRISTTINNDANEIGIDANKTIIAEVNFQEKRS